MLRRKKWLPIAIFIFFIQIALEAFAGWYVVRLNMLPFKYLLVVLAGLALMLVLTAVLLFAGTGHGPSHARRARRIVAIVLAVVMGLGSVYASMVIAKVDQTVDKVTESNTTLAAMVGVYVMKDDPADTIEAAKDYTFGVMQNFDQDNTAKAVTAIEKQTGSKIATNQLPSVTESAAALYDGSVNALILNEAYVSILTDTEDYADFSDKTRVLYEVPIEKTVTADDERTAANTRSSSATSEEKEQALADVAADSDITARPFALYISGSDTRSKMLDTSRSDVNIIMVVNPTSKQILLLNTPRDYYVANPAGGGKLDKLTHCGIYGIDVSMKALEDLYGLDLDYYMQINFTGFEKLIDAIGGITVDVPQGFTNENGGDYTFTTGPNQMNGKKALAFARERYALASGDNERGKNQMRVIEAVINKISSGGATLLLNYADILNSLQGMFVTDMSSEDIAALVKMQLDDGGSWNIKKYAVTGKGGSDYTYSMPNTRAYVMYQNADLVSHASDLVDKVEAGQTLTDADVAEN